MRQTDRHTHKAFYIVIHIHYTYVCPLSVSGGVHVSSVPLDQWPGRAGAKESETLSRLRLRHSPL